MSGFNERAKRQIALLAGDDLEGGQADEARRSVEACPKCRGHWVRVRGCLDVLERTGKQVEAAAGPSVWPALEARLRRPSVIRSERFNGWVPALSMAAACIALLIAGQMEASPPQDFVDDQLTGVSPAAWGRPAPEPAPRGEEFRAEFGTARPELWIDGLGEPMPRADGSPADPYGIYDVGR